MLRHFSRRLGKRSCGLIELRTELDEWCQSYVTAFSAYDADGIAAHWTFPAVILRGGRSVTFKSAEHFSKNTGMLLGFYKEHAVDRAIRRLVDCFAMTDDTVAMTVADEMVTATGEVIVSWQAAYVMQRVDGKWLAVLAQADGELSAWAERGTPLG